VKILSFCLIEGKSSLSCHNIENGRWYHLQRTVSVETKTHAAFVTMGIFERAIASILKACSLGCFDYKAFLLDKTVALLDRANVENLGSKVSNIANSVGSSSSSSFHSRAERKTHVSVPAECLRDAYPSFAVYRKERESLGEPVDLIIGRGTKIETGTPKLNEQRQIDQHRMKPYHPFTIDSNPSQCPDLNRSILIAELPEFPDSSVDDIYLERIHPYQVWSNLRLYYHAFRILKEDGTLVIDFNDGMRSKEHRENQILVFNDTFRELGIMLLAKLADKSFSRNDLDVPKFVCVKYGNQIPTKLMPRYLLEKNKALENKLKELHQQYAARDGNGKLLIPSISW
jgi:hypothetical protein